MSDASGLPPGVAEPVPEPPEHVWGEPDAFEERQGARWCRRCGCLIWRANGGALTNVRPCRVVPVTFRGATVGEVTEVRREDGGISVTMQTGE